MSEALPDSAAVYRCPGERHAISRAVHLARLSAGFAGCRHCPQWEQLPGYPSGGAGNGGRAAALVRSAWGFRGHCGRDWSLSELEPLCQTFAAWVWAHGESRPLIAAPPGTQMSRPLAPSIVIGFDARPEAPGLARTVGQLLRQAGCHLVDIGVSSGPLTAFAVRHLAARAGVWISGADAPVGWSGLDLLTSSGGLPPAELLRQLVETAPASRPARGGGELETFDPIPAYQADLTRALREVRAVRSLLAAANPLTQVIGERVLSETACRVTWSAELQRGLPVPVVAEQTLQAELFAGISEDGRQLATADERGVRLLPQQLLAILADAHVSQRGTVRIAYDRHTWAPMVDAAPVCAATYIPVDSRFGETISARMSETTADLGLDRHGQVWQGGLAPVCDALQVLAGILSGLSVRTGSLSRWVGEAPERLQPAGGLA